MAENLVMERAGDILGKKYGPLPFGAWLGIVAVAAYATRRLIKGNQAAKDASTNSDSEGYVVDSSGNKFASAYTGTVGGGATPFGTGSVTSAASSGTAATAATETDNTGWARRAAEKLQSANMWNPLDVQGALARYITGESLNDKQSAIVNQAIKMEGQPPVALYGVDTNSANSSTYTPTIVRFVTGYGPNKQAVFAQYSDNSVRVLRSSDELYSVAKNSNNPSLFNTASGKVVMTTLPSDDPIWGNIVWAAP